VGVAAAHRLAANRILGEWISTRLTHEIEVFIVETDRAKVGMGENLLSSRKMRTFSEFWLRRDDHSSASLRFGTGLALNFVP